MAARMQYVYEYLDATYAADLQAKLDARADAGFAVNTATLAHPYMFVLWERAHPDATDEEKRDSQPGGARQGGSAGGASPSGSRA
jgi:hypothetical protein